MIIHLTGPDTYRSRVRLHQLREAFIAKHDPRGLNVVVLDGATATANEIRAAVRGGGLFAKKNFIVVNAYDPVHAICASSELIDILKPITKDTETIVVVRDGAQRTTTKKKPSKGKTSSVKVFRIPDAKREEFWPLTLSEAKQWLMKEAKKSGGELSGSVAEKLLVACDNDSWRMGMELEKLLLHANGRPITSDDVHDVVVAGRTSDLFALTDAIGARQRARAISLLHNELAAGVHPLALIAMIARHLRTLRQVQQAVAEGLSRTQIPTALDLHPFVVTKALEQSKKFSAAELGAWHHYLLETDWRLKSTPLDAEAMLDVLAVKA